MKTHEDFCKFMDRMHFHVKEPNASVGVREPTTVAKAAPVDKSGKKAVPAGNKFAALMGGDSSEDEEEEEEEEEEEDWREGGREQEM